MAKSRAFARKALELDERLPEAHVALAITQYLGDWDWEGAEQSLLRALELNPGYARAHFLYAVELAYLGRIDEAMAHAERTAELSPREVRFPKETDLGRLYELAGRPNEAMLAWQAVLELDPANTHAHRHMGNSHCQKRDYEMGIELLERARNLAPRDAIVAADLAYCYAVSGSREQALEIVRALEAFSEQTYVSPMTIALVRLGLGENEVALDWLERAYEVRALRTPSIGLDPRFEPLRSHPRFQDLLRRVGLLEDADAGGEDV